MGAVEALQQTLGLTAPPRVIEGFDISHQAGAHTRAAMVRFQDGAPDKAGYRTFGMKTVGAGKGKEVKEVDDYASLHEAVTRRYRGVLEAGDPLPDLVLIDGGPGQRGAARDALAALGLPDLHVASLAKRDEEVFLPGHLHPLRLPRDHAGLQLAQRVRDEAHRFGITQVRRKATAAVAASPLDEVPGIGPKRRALLVKAFGGLEGLKAASVEDLCRVPGVTPTMAEKIVAALAG
jgi:excinuclease ABC subunit C